ncbi:fumarylacetoacetate hydrolase family protein [Microbacterium sp. KUDC0406]|uniref:fumarylacetoacetate hydrolase family protein n=1 Tax=Microbacterium sp. KUDC0406 TaxID=2909588 RepID=UPI001F21F9BD|nr:fumarylacetoacetate hydrolase family protein [Microbacterium sp. KUDC0406]UJP10575.1 fumarylacetoacetate hydrolase family protein [Microbacterium sp. KUDC0406]
MLIGRVLTAAGASYVRVDGERLVPVDDPFAAFADGRMPGDAGFPVTGEILAPCEPRVVIGIAQNGVEHPAPVQAWLKSPHTVVPHGAAVRLRRDAGETVAEGEIAVVIGRSTDGLTAQNAHEYVLGATAVNDLSSPERTVLDPRNFESKSGEGYTPLGPWIDTEADLDDIGLELTVGDAQTIVTAASALPSSIRDCLAYVASWSVLHPGDVVMTGAPFSQAPVRPGETMTVRVGQAVLVTPTT